MSTQPNRKKDIKPSRKKVNKKRKIVIVAVVLLVAGLAAGGLSWWRYVATTEDSAVTGSSDETDEFVEQRTQAQQDASGLLYAALADGSDEKIAESTQELLRLIEATDEEQEKIAYLSALVELHQDTEQYDAALTYAVQLDELEQSDISAAGVAGVYFAMENFSEAARYYQIAADRSETTDDPTEETPYIEYMSNKSEAEARL